MKGVETKRTSTPLTPHRAEANTPKFPTAQSGGGFFLYSTYNVGIFIVDNADDSRPEEEEEAV